MDEMTGKLVLVIEEERPWRQTDLMHRQLADKVQSYFRYICSEEFNLQYGLTPRDTIVRLVSAERPGEPTRLLLERIGHELGKHGIYFECQVGNGRPVGPPPAAAEPKPDRRTVDRSTPSRPSQIRGQAQSVRGSPAAVSGAFSQKTAASAKPAKPSPSRTRPPPVNSASRGQRVFRTVLILTWIVVASATLLWGLKYYLLPIQLRAYSDLHDLFKPSGTVGLWYGIIGSLFITVGVVMYSVRKRVRVLIGAGKLNSFLQFHIFLCTLGPYLVLLHTSFKFGGVVAIAFWSMVTAVLSGIFGRYLYSWLPKTLSGQFLALQSIQRQKEELIQTITESSGLRSADIDRLFHVAEPRGTRGILAGMVLAIRYDLTKRSLKGKIRRRLASTRVPVYTRESVIALVRDQIKLQQQIALLSPFQRLFGLWHIIHLPLSAVMFLIMFVHIFVAALFGYAFIF